MDPEVELQRGKRAQRLLEDPLLVEAFEALEQRFLSAMRQAKPEESEKREEAALCLWALDAFRGELRNLMLTGRLADHELREHVAETSPEGRLILGAGSNGRSRDR